MLSPETLKWSVVSQRQQHTIPGLQAMHVPGTGQAFWVDAEAGFTPADQEALIQYVLAPGQALAPTP